MLRQSTKSEHKTESTVNTIVSGLTNNLFAPHYFPKLLDMIILLEGTHGKKTDADERNFLLACMYRALSSSYVFATGMIIARTDDQENATEFYAESCKHEKLISKNFDIEAFASKYKIEVANPASQEHLRFVFVVGSFYPQYVVNYIHALARKNNNALTTEDREQVLAVFDRSERHALSVYAALLQTRLPEDVRDTLQRRYEVLAQIEADMHENTRLRSIHQVVRQQLLQVVETKAIEKQARVVGEKETQLAFVTAKLGKAYKLDLTKLKAECESALRLRSGCEALLAEERPDILLRLSKADRHLAQNPNPETIALSASIKKLLVRADKLLTLILICDNVYTCKGTTPFFATPPGIAKLKEQLSPIKVWLDKKDGKTVLQDDCIDAVLAKVSSTLHVKSQPYKGRGNRKPLTQACYTESASLLDELNTRLGGATKPERKDGPSFVRKL